ncbi:MAG: enoyl-CoA hydratase/isomerase family protein, partial [Deltaproteobacteria bacterium]|nr:enoyl-CoA hydratase/isomerase family protein [Deltaproteobacteria bacterium]
LDLELDEALNLELANLAAIFGTEDASEGLSKIGRARPKFKGR